MMNWLSRLFRRGPELICMRLADMTVVHPKQIIAKCSSCGEDIAVYPSGQQVMRDHPDVRLVCQVCRPRPTGRPAPGAMAERLQSVRKK